MVLLKIQEHYHLKNGFEVIIHKHIKPGSGLGSSAASAAGAAMGANIVLGNIMSKDEMVHFAMFGKSLLQEFAMQTILHHAFMEGLLW